MPGRSGVWLRADARGPERKIAALGIRVSQGVTMHGFALNCDVDLAWYDAVRPLRHRRRRRHVAVAPSSAATSRCHDVLPSVRRHLTDLLAWAPYTPTPDYEPRPEPGRATRVPVLGLPG